MDKVLPIVHTSDLIVWRRCRRKAYWGSYMFKNLRSRTARAPLWFGTGAHYALEDKHGHNKHGSAAQAFVDYGAAHAPKDRPEDYDDLMDTAKRMMEYYDLWLEARKKKGFDFETYWVDGEPQNEVKFTVPLLNSQGEPIAIYEGVFDGVVVDSKERLWLKEYKTARQYNTSKLENDFQVTAYTWAASQVYGQPFEGVLYMQFHKTPPKQPKVLKNGDVSVAKNQRTTFQLYWDFLKKHCGGKEKVPLAHYKPFLQHLYEQENDWGDPFIRYDLVRRNLEELVSFEANVGAQLQEMLDPNTYIYPNPTQDCSWDCDFRDACISQEKGYDYEQILELNFLTRDERARQEDWRDRLVFGKDTESD